MSQDPSNGAEGRPDLLTRHFGAVITGLVALVGAGLGYVQFTTESKRLAEEQEARRAQDEREWKLALTSFAVENYDQIFSDNETQRARLQALMQATFPDRVLQAFYEAQVREATTFTEVRRTANALQSLQRHQARPADDGSDAAEPSQPVRESPEPLVVEATAFVQYGAQDDESWIKAMMAELRDAGFRTPGSELVEAFAEGKPDVRYFHAENENDAERALEILRDRLPEGMQVPSAPSYLGESYDAVPEGIVEVWVPDIPED